MKVLKKKHIRKGKDFNKVFKDYFVQLQCSFNLRPRKILDYKQYEFFVRCIRRGSKIELEMCLAVEFMNLS